MPHDGRALVPSPKRSSEPASNIDTARMDSMKALDPTRPIREAEMEARLLDVRYPPGKQTLIEQVESAALKISC
jgi:hypothetical protein